MWLPLSLDAFVSSSPSSVSCFPQSCRLLSTISPTLPCDDPRLRGRPHCPTLPEQLPHAACWLPRVSGEAADGCGEVRSVRHMKLHHSRSDRLWHELSGLPCCEQPFAVDDFDGSSQVDVAGRSPRLPRLRCSTHVPFRCVPLLKTQSARLLRGRQIDNAEEEALPAA